MKHVQQSSDISVHYICQKEPEGLGHAVWCPRKFIGGTPFRLRYYLVMIF
ncbi:hypothetical protein [Halalkalibacillus sediminis]|nr:hypothetical protein [Halalkalibacillus sediminis]